MLLINYMTIKFGLLSIVLTSIINQDVILRLLVFISGLWEED